MSVPLGEVHLVHPGGAIVLRRAALLDQGADFDLATFRAPFGHKWHAVGTRQPTAASLVQVTGVLEGPTPADSDQLRDDALAALPTVTRIDIGERQILVAGAVGAVPVVATDRGWRITAAFVASDEPWLPVEPVGDDTISSLAFDDPGNSGWLGVL